MLVVAETALFFHPAIWWVTRRIRIERELCCDDIAVYICADAAGYADALLSLHSLKQSRTFALASNGGTLMHRISRLIGVPEELHKSPLAPIIGVFLLCLVAAAVSAQTFPMFSIRIVDDTAALSTSAIPPEDDLVPTL